MDDDSYSAVVVELWSEFDDWAPLVVVAAGVDSSSAAFDDVAVDVDGVAADGDIDIAVVVVVDIVAVVVAVVLDFVSVVTVVVVDIVAVVVSVVVVACVVDVVFVFAVGNAVVVDTIVVLCVASVCVAVSVTAGYIVDMVAVKADFSQIGFLVIPQFALAQCLPCPNNIKVQKFPDSMCTSGYPFSQ